MWAVDFLKFLITNAFGSCPTCKRLPWFSTWHACKVCKKKVFGPTGLLVHTYDLFWVLDLFFAQNIWPQLMYILLLINTNTTRRWRKVMVVISKTIEEWCMGSWPLDIVSKMVFVFCVRDNTCVLCNSFVQRHSHIWWWSHTYGTHLHISRMRDLILPKKRECGISNPEGYTK